MKYFTQANAMFWKWDGTMLRVWECGRWIKSLFSGPEDLKRVIGESVEDIDEKELPQEVVR